MEMLFVLEYTQRQMGRSVFLMIHPFLVALINTRVRRVGVRGFLGLSVGTENIRAGLNM